MGKASNPLRPAGQRQGLDTVWEWNLGPRAESGMIWVWPQVLSRHSIFPHANGSWFGKNLQRWIEKVITVGMAP